MPSDFVHLHVHTEYSLLDGQSQIEKLMARAKELDQPAMAITDHGVMFGAIDFFRAATAAGIKPVIGMEAYLAPRSMTDKDPVLDKKPYHLLLLAKNMEGYLNLCTLASEAQLNGYYYRPRVDKDLLAKHAKGIIATTGCLAAEIPRLVEEGREDKAHEMLGWYYETFGADNFYLELQNHDIGELHALNTWLYNYRNSGHTPLKLLATNDVHYVMETDADSHDTLLCIQTGALKNEQNRMTLSPFGSYYLKSADEMRRDFKDAPEEMVREAFASTLEVAAMTDLNLTTKGYHLPAFPVPEGFTASEYVRMLCEMGLEWRYPGQGNDPKLRERLDYELNIIDSMGFNTYFLIVWDLCEFARSADIWWNVRGSGAASLVAYSMGITGIDPIQNSLLFERFLNPGRVSMPDIDLDYPDNQRGKMIAYATEKYGEDKVAAIITFGTMGAKASVKDVGRALGVDAAKINKAASLIPQEAKQKALQDYIDTNPELKDFYDSDSDIQTVMETAIKLQGMTRHASMHAAGVIISDKPLHEYLPLHRITGNTDASDGILKRVTQFPMETAESIGLLKVDFLGLSTLTILRKACDLIEQHQHIKYTMENIPYRHDDARLTEEQVKMLDKTFEMLSRGETVGVFQLESGGMQQMLRGMRPFKFDHIVAGVSLYRPGPMEFIPLYNRRMHGEEKINYLHPRLEQIIGDTYAVITYQEQISQIASQLFGYTLGEADLMRRAVSKKKDKDLLEHKAIFKARGPENGVDEETAEKIFDEIEFFANYGFNRAHATDYAWVTLQTAYLKCHYPEEYMTALLCVQFDDSDKVATFLEECRRLQIPVLPPDVNYSMVDFDIEAAPDGRRAIRFGMGAIKHAGVGVVQLIIDERQRGGQFTSLEDFCQRCDLRTIGKRTMESLIKVGAFNSLYPQRDALFESLERIIGFSTDYHKAKEVGQKSLFGDSAGAFGSTLQITAASKPVKPREQLVWEKELLGLYVTGRPVDPHKDKFRHARLNIIQELKGSLQDEIQKMLYSGKKVRVAGEVVSLRKIVTKNNEMMCVFQLEDWHDTAGSIEIVLFPKTWNKVAGYFAKEGREFAPGEIVMVEGEFDTSRDSAQIKANNISTDFEFVMADSNYADDMALPAYTGSSRVAVEYDDEGNPIYSEEPPLPAYLDRPVNGNGSNGSGHHDAAVMDFLGEQVKTSNRHVRVYLKRSDDADKDRRKLRRVHGLLTTYPGSDGFSIVIEGGTQKSVTMNFPNHTTQYCSALLDELAGEVGEDGIVIR